MEPHTAPDAEPGERTGRPRTVDRALMAILARCVLALAAAFALFGAKDELRRNGAQLHPEWSPATLADKIDSQLRSNVVLTLVYIGLVLLIAKYIRDGRNWARWLYVFIAFLVAGDVLRVAGFFTGDNLLFRLLSGLTGVAATVAIVLLFLPSSSAYFRPAGGSARSLFGGLTALGAARGKTGQPADAPVSFAKPVGARGKAESARPAAPADSRPSASNRPGPRAKSRKQAAE